MNRVNKRVCASQSVESVFVFWLTSYLTLNPSMMLGLMTPHEIQCCPTKFSPRFEIIYYVEVPHYFLERN